jgi:hypothetical protein
MPAETEYLISFSAPNAFGASEVFASHPPLSPHDSGYDEGYLNIGKEIRSNTLSPATLFKFINNVG